MKRGLARSPWFLHYDTGSCNGCDIELISCLSPRYDLERFGIVNKGNPKLADILLVVGPITRKSRPVIENLYAQMPEPKVVVAVGTCCSERGIFDGCYGVECLLDEIIPVDVYIPGCSARPTTIVEGINKAIDLWRNKVEEHKGR